MSSSNKNIVKGVVFDGKKWDFDIEKLEKTAKEIRRLEKKEDAYKSAA